MPSSGTNLGEGLVQFPSSDGLPDWALTYTDAALRSGQSVPEIQQYLVKKGMPTAIAEALVFRCLELRIQRIEQSRKRARRWVWTNRVAFLVAIAGYVAAFYSVEAPARRIMGYGIAIILTSFGSFCELFGRNQEWFSSDELLRRSIFLAIAGWVFLLVLAMVLKEIAL
jgi:hypothetical protein